MSKKIFSLLLAGIFTASTVIVAGCGEASESSGIVSGETSMEASANNELTIDETTAEAMSDGRSQVKDNLPDDLDFGGAEIRLISQAEFANYDTHGEDSGDVVWDAVYKRNIDVEERLNVKLVISELEGRFTDFDALVRTSVLSGSDDYDFFMQRGNNIFSCSVDGFYTEIGNNKYIDTDAPWWWMDIVTDTAINNKHLYYLTGDLSLSTFILSTVWFFNKNQFADLGYSADELYTIVFDGKWTYDVLDTYCKNVYKDINGNGTADEEDYYALSYYSPSAAWLIYSAGLKFTSRDNDGYPVLNINNPDSPGLLEKVNHLLHDDNYALYVETAVDKYNKFATGNTLFLIGRFQSCIYTREMEDEFGYIPYPKYSENLNYMSGVGGSGGFIGIPVTCQKVDTTCAVIEALCAESYRSVFPKYYETALKIKYTNDNRDSQMIDLLHDNIYVDFMSTSGLNIVLTDLVADNSNNFASAYARKEKSIQRELDKLIAKYNEISG